MKFFDKLRGRKAAEADEQVTKTPLPPCEHDWQRVVETQGATVLVNTKCAKCGALMPPKKTVHYDMR
jgi:hypothetical protein